MSEKVFDLVPNPGGLPIGEVLHDVRVILDVPLEELAARLKTTPEAVAEVENAEGDDLSMFALRDHVEALGGILHAEIVLADGKRFRLHEFCSQVKGAADASAG